MKTYLIGLLTAVGVAVLAASAAAQRTYADPEAAAAALLEATRANDIEMLKAIFGNGAEAVIDSGDPVDDAKSRKWFVERASDKMTILREDEDWALVTVGKDAWPVAIPLHKANGTWTFDLDEGKEELLDRRIGGNELVAISVLRACADAQRQYAAEDLDGNGVHDYARRILSTAGQRDGLFWPIRAGEAPSPFGPRVAEAAAKGYQRTTEAGAPAPYEGYFYKILTRQGAKAPGGAMSYDVDGKLTKGFAVVASPASYGVSGIKTFIVNQLGIVFEKDLGSETATLASDMEAYEPDRTWSPSAD
jgi:TPR repeat protein